MREAADAEVIEWSAPEDPRFRGVTGDVVWSDSLQAGFMRLRGMPANDPAREQYQLWIVDPERAAQPVDGGVFDIRDATGEIIVPIQAKLAVDDPAAFAITLEKPGGVVVSAGPLLVVAPAS
jgi:anti-sigma-K factor RskA